MLDRLRYIINILIVVLMFAAVAIKNSDSLAGTSLEEILQKKTTEANVPVETVGKNGERVINSTALAQNVVGYAGRTPIELRIRNNKIESVTYLENSETPEFFEQVTESGLAKKWVGMSPTEAASTPIDAVSGATYSSKAIIENVQRAAQFVSNAQTPKQSLFAEIGLNGVAGIVVLLFGIAMSFIKTKNKKLRVVQLVLNVAVLGFWSGSFLSLVSITSWISNGINLTLSIIALLMLAITLIMPLFGKKGTYCHNHCPMGAAQELMNFIPAVKLKIGGRTAKILNNIRYYIFAVLIFMMWLGFGCELINYEVFSAFIFTSASPIVLGMALLFLLLSAFTSRPYCRFVCPTGALITISQITK